MNRDFKRIIVAISALQERQNHFELCSLCQKNISDVRKQQVANDIAILQRALELLMEKPKKPMSLRKGIVKVLQQSNKPLTIDEIMMQVKLLEIKTDRGTLRARLSKNLGKDFIRTEKGTYSLL